MATNTSLCFLPKGFSLHFLHRRGTRMTSTAPVPNTSPTDFLLLLLLHPILPLLTNSSKSGHGVYTSINSFRFSYITFRE